MGGGRGGAVDSSISITVNGGNIFLSSYGDGFDSNGNFTINGGTIISNSPVVQGENALEYDGTFRSEERCVGKEGSPLG